MSGVGVFLAVSGAVVLRAYQDLSHVRVTGRELEIVMDYGFFRGRKRVTFDRMEEGEVDGTPVVRVRVGDRGWFSVDVRGR